MQNARLSQLAKDADVLPPTQNNYDDYIDLYFAKEAADRQYNKTIQYKKERKTTIKQQQKRTHMTYHRFNFASLLMA